MKKQIHDYKPHNKLEESLALAFTDLTKKQDTMNFMRDLLTPSEIEEFSKRLFIAELLENTKMSYMDIATKAKTSTTTVTRVAQWLNNGCGGYKKVLKNTK